MKLRSIKNAPNLSGKTILVKVDFNVPLKTIGNTITVADDTRLKLALPTINFLLAKNCRLILMSHVGRPEGKPDDRYRMDPIAQALKKLIKNPVYKVDFVTGDVVLQAIAGLKPAQILLLENNRFEPGEESNDEQLAKTLASYADIYVNDGFSLSHRAHASVEAITRFIPSYAGLSLQTEVDMLSKLLEQPKRPFVAIVGGAKISDKIDAIKNLAKVADVILVGGGVANNFLKAEHFEIFNSYLQDSVVDERKKDINYVDFSKNLLDTTRQQNSLMDGFIPLPKIVYPIDVIAASSPDSQVTAVIDLINMPSDLPHKDLMFLDIGPNTIKLFEHIIYNSRTVFWNGPMGMFEKSNFTRGTKSVAKAIASASATSVLGGGDTIAAINVFGLSDKYSYVSAAGGASLEFLGGNILPGIKPLLI